ncbi:MAG: hypothetical protein PHQ28_08370 [Mycobacterium sp.]|nr:hypothetical protein [Mycobacterium sp.]
MDGRSRVIHMLWNGFLPIVSESHEEARARWTVGCAWWIWAACRWVAFDQAVACDHAAGSGSVDAENFGRSAEPAMRATNTLKAAAIAAARRHRSRRPAP